MEFEGWKGKLYWTVELITLLAVLQLMWIGLTLLGLVLFGITPATVAMFTTLRKRLLGEDDLKLLVKTYWKTYKMELISSNKIGIIILGIGYFLTINFQLISLFHGMTGLLLLTFFMTISILFCIMVLNIFQIYAHYELPSIRYFAVSILFSVAYPLQMIGSIVGLAVLYLIFSWIPGLLPFFGVSLTALFLSWMSSHIFKKKTEAEAQIKAEHYPNEGVTS
ncbi:YesL family protein [Lysinibacillus xylanilyticus]|uniref:YesL family protein n=1 Tax=Lysinibacillus xylanilyticus TaxID=582475 RepID=UPI0037F69263